MSDISNNKKQLRALIVEDVESDALLLVDNLESNGFTLDWQRVDTEQAMLSALNENWDIVFSDFSMPNFSGNKALQILRQHDPDIPLIFVSGTIGEESAVQAMKSGAQDYVMKGNMARLQTAVERELRESHLRRKRRKADEDLNKLSMVVKQTADSVFITDPEGVIEYVNPACEKQTGFSKDELIGSKPSILLSGLNEAEAYNKLWDTILGGNIYSGTMVNKRKNGELFHEEKVITPLFNEENKITHFVSTGRDITERVFFEEERERFVSVLEETPDMVIIFDPDFKLIYLNSAGRKLLGISPDTKVEYYHLRDFFPELMVKHLLNTILPSAKENGIWNGETELMIDNDTHIPFSLVVLSHNDSHGNVKYMSAIARNITERKQFEMELQHLATHDSLTNLPNRLFLKERFLSMLEHCRRHEKYIAVLFLDLDNFKRVNDILGHDTGDNLLVQVANRIMNCLGSSDYVARVGGDEFCVIIDDLDQEDSALSVLRKLRENFKDSVVLENNEVYVTFSAGIAIFPHDGEQIEDLLRHADTAMYEAKDAGGAQYRFYSSEMNARGHELLLLEADLQRALENNEFCLYYQPQVSLDSGKITGVEALIRWQHPNRGLVSPADFIPLLEKSRMIIPVGEWVLRTACQQHRAWRENGYSNIRISVNVSAVQFSDEKLLDNIQTVLKEEQMPANMLELEITENVVMHNPVTAIEILQTLTHMGVRTAIDDFGTGYSSLAYLKRFPLNVLKIDQTFIRELCEDPDDAAIVEASISLAQKLDLEIVAEGVENRDQLEFLRACDSHIMIQGYYLSRPVSAGELMTLLAKKTLLVDPPLLDEAN